MIKIFNYKLTVEVCLAVASIITGAIDMMRMITTTTINLPKLGKNFTGIVAVKQRVQVKETSAVYCFYFCFKYRNSCQFVVSAAVAAAYVQVCCCVRVLFLTRYFQLLIMVLFNKSSLVYSLQDTENTQACYYRLYRTLSL